MPRLDKDSKPKGIWNRLAAARTTQRSPMKSAYTSFSLRSSVDICIDFGTCRASHTRNRHTVSSYCRTTHHLHSPTAHDTESQRASRHVGWMSNCADPHILFAFGGSRTSLPLPSRICTPPGGAVGKRRGGKRADRASGLGGWWPCCAVLGAGLGQRLRTVR
jgi:hypothetical protein